MATKLQQLQAALAEEKARRKAKNERATREKDQDSYDRLVQRINAASDRDIERALAAH
jgi:hypothetical protein